MSHHDDLIRGVGEGGMTARAAVGGVEGGEARAVAGDHRVILADCLGPEGLATLPDKSCAHVICDPPYSERVHRGLGAERRSDGSERDALSFSHLTSEQQALLAREFSRVARRWILVFTDDMNLFTWAQALRSSGAEYVVKGTWVKLAPMPQMDGTRPAYATEEIVVAHAARERGRTRWNGGGRPALYEANPQDPGRVHPTQKPLPLMEQLVSDFTDPGELVCDPFAGSGTTGVACKRLGRRFIGWERDPKCHAIAAKRIEAAREQYALRLDAGPEPKQQDLLGRSPLAREG